MPAGMKHFAWTTGETVVQLSGIGPQSINYLNPEDDPRPSERKEIAMEYLRPLPLSAPRKKCQLKR